MLGYYTISPLFATTFNSGYEIVELRMDLFLYSVDSRFS